MRSKLSYAKAAVEQAMKMREVTFAGAGAKNHLVEGGGASLNSAPLRPEGLSTASCGPPSRLKMNSLRSALTAARVGHYRGRGN